MITRQFPIGIDPSAPFAQDQLDRKASAENLTNLLQSSTDPFVLALDAAWGRGKTTFVGMWKQHLENKGATCLYFNAWENDFASDPLVSFVGEMKSIIETGDYSGSNETEARDRFNQMKETAHKITKRAVPIALRLLTQGLVNLESDEIESAVADFAEKVAVDQIEEYEAGKKSLRDFRSSLEAFAKSVTHESEFPLVFFVDELDRCRPTYTLELLERIKHLFNVPKVIFVLSIDKQQLSNSIRAVYGDRFSARRYLRRFIDLEFNLPDPALDKYAPYLIERLDLLNRIDQSNRFYVQDTLVAASLILKPSLRQLEVVAVRLSIILKTYGQLEFIACAVLPFLLVLRETEPEEYRNLVSGTSTAQSLIDKISQMPCEHRTNNYSFRSVLFAAFAAFHTNNSRVALEMEALFNKRGEAEEDAGQKTMRLKSDYRSARRLFTSIMDSTDFRYNRSPIPSMERLESMIEFSDRFDETLE